MTTGGRAFAALAALGTLLVVAPAPARAVDAALVEAARKEGQVVWYTTMIVNQAVRPLAKAFQDKYPGIEVRFSRADSGPSALKIINEARAGKVQADVFDGIDTVSPLLRANLVAKYVPSSADRYPPELKDADGYWTATNLYFFTPGMNTQLVPKDQAPKTYQDLLDPKWKGKLVWCPSPPAGAPTFVGMILGTMGEEKGMAYLRELSKQRIINVDATPRSILDQVIAGEYPLALMIFNHHAVVSAEKGAPVAWLKIDPVPATFGASGLLKDASHPNAGKLLLEFLASEDGQKVLAEVNYLPAMPSVPAKEPSLKPKEGGFRAYYFSPTIFANEMSKWTAIANDLFK